MADVKNNFQIHRTISNDGTEISGRVHGEGPPLVLLSGTCEGEAFPLLVPQLSKWFTCYSLSLRGRGLSADHPDHTPERLVEDVRAFADSIEGPVGLAAHSRGAALSLSAVAHTNSVSALAVYEPHVIELYSSEQAARAQQAVGLMRAAADEGRIADAIRAFFRDIAPLDDGDLAAVSTPEAAELFAPAVPLVIRDASQWDLPRSRDLLELEKVTVPVLLLYGGNSHGFYVDVVRYLAGQLPNADVRKIDGLGHLGPLFSPGPVAEEIASFFSLYLLRRHIRGCSGALTGFREFSISNLRYTKIQNFYRSFFCNNQVRRFDIAMDHSFIMCRSQSFGSLYSNID